jgi:hypothetical protein
MKPFLFFLFGILICGSVFWTIAQHSTVKPAEASLSSDMIDRNKQVEVQAQKIDIKRLNQRTQ